LEMERNGIGTFSTIVTDDEGNREGKRKRYERGLELREMAAGKGGEGKRLIGDSDYALTWL